MLDISANVVHKAFAEDALELIIVENVTAPHRMLGQFVSVLLDAEPTLAQGTDRTVRNIDDVCRCVRAHKVMHGLRMRFYLLILGM